jgi:hypothetical protein
MILSTNGRNFLPGASVLVSQVYNYPGQMDTVLLLKFPHHILNCKTKRVYA